MFCRKFFINALFIVLSLQICVVKPAYNISLDTIKNKLSLQQYSRRTKLGFVTVALSSILCMYCMYELIKYWKNRGNEGPDIDPIDEEPIELPDFQNPINPEDHKDKDPIDKKDQKVDDDSDMQIQRCSICWGDNPSKDCTTLSCGHTFCNRCLERQADIAIKDKKTNSLVCPDYNCRAPIEPDQWKKVTENNPQKFEQLADIATKNWLSRQPNAKQCPTPDCPYIFINDDDDACKNPKNVRCPQCQETYCSSCLNQHSSRVPCEQAKTKEDRSNERWKRRNTKPCPNCNAIIEKNSGCLHMSCGNCRHRFCWLCLGPQHRDFSICHKRPGKTFLHMFFGWDV